MPGRQQGEEERARCCYLHPSDALDVLLGRPLWLRLGDRQSKRGVRDSWDCKLEAARHAFRMYHFPEVAAGDRTRSSLRVVGGLVRIGPSGSEVLATGDSEEGAVHSSSGGRRDSTLPS